MLIFSMLSCKKRMQVETKVEKRLVKGKQDKKKEEVRPWKNHTSHRTHDRATSRMR